MLWVFPGIYFGVLSKKTVELSTRCIAQLQLKNNGKDVVVTTLMGFRFVKPVNVFRPYTNLKEFLKTDPGLASEMGLYPIVIEDNLFFLSKEGEIADSMLFKAICNGVCIQTKPSEDTLNV